MRKVVTVIALLITWWLMGMANMLASHGGNFASSTLLVALALLLLLGIVIANRKSTIAREVHIAVGVILFLIFASSTYALVEVLISGKPAYDAGIRGQEIFYRATTSVLCFAMALGLLASFRKQGLRLLDSSRK